jgi:large subunit ribosomal protein L22
MQSTAKLSYFKMSPKKARLVADLLRGKKLDEAVRICCFLRKKAARVMEGVLRSAAANAGNKDGMDTGSLFVSRILVNEGPMMKRFIPRAQGRATPILKRSCHIDVVLEDKPDHKVVKEKEPVEVKAASEGVQPADAENEAQGASIASEAKQEKHSVKKNEKTKAASKRHSSGKEKHTKSTEKKSVSDHEKETSENKKIVKRPKKVKENNQ